MQVPLNFVVILYMNESNSFEDASLRMSSRIRQARELAGISRSDLARQIGVKPSAAFQWEKAGGTSPSTSNLAHVATITGVSFEWLATARGPARREQDTLAPDAVAMDLFEESLLKVVRRLPPEARPPLLALLKVFEKSLLLSP